MRLKTVFFIAVITFISILTKSVASASVKSSEPLKTSKIIKIMMSDSTTTTKGSTISNKVSNYESLETNFNVNF